MKITWVLVEISKPILKGNNFDNIEGVANLQNFKIVRDSAYYSTDKAISLEAASPAFNQKTIRFRSAFIDADVLGHFNFADLRVSVLDFVNDIFTIEEIISKDSTFQKPGQIEDQELAFDFKFKDINSFAKLILPEFTAVDTAYLKGSFNSDKKQFKVDGLFPKLVYGNYEVDTIRINSNGTSNQLNTKITLNQARSGDLIDIPIVTFKTLFSNDSLNFGLGILQQEQITNSYLFETPASSKIDTSLELNGSISYADEEYSLSFSPAFVLNNEIWEIAKNNRIEYSNKNLKVSNLILSNEGKEIAVNSRGVQVENDFQAIEIQISDFDLVEISRLFGMKENEFRGMINGNLTLKEPKTNLHYNTEILIGGMSYNEKLIGDLEIKAKQPSQDQVIDLSLQLDGKNQMSVAGIYEIPNKLFDLDFQFGKLSLFLIDPFLTGVLKNSDGFLSGEMQLKGSPDQPDVKGTLNLSNFRTTAVISNMQYLAEKATFQISEKAIDLGTVTLKDAKDNNAVLSGKILHDYFQNIVFDLNFSTDAFQFLNTTIVDNNLYFGDLFLKAAVKIKGTPELPVLIIDATTLPNSQLFVQPFSGIEVIKQENYVIFANPNNYNEDSLQLVEKRITGNRNEFDLDLQLHVTNDATLNIVIDPETGDQLISVGTANLTLNINPAGDMTAVGNYTIDRGSYSLNYEQLVKRDFEINKGKYHYFFRRPYECPFQCYRYLQSQGFHLRAAQQPIHLVRK